MPSFKNEEHKFNYQYLTGEAGFYPSYYRGETVEELDGQIRRGIENSRAKKKQGGENE